MDIKRTLHPLRLYLRERFLEQPVLSAISLLRRIPRGLLFHCRRHRNAYLRSHTVHKLQLGSGLNPMAGWLNTDFDPRTREVIFLDVRRRFPFRDAQFDYIFAEHMVQYFTFARCHHVLGECLRVLKPGGHIRIVTPDLDFFTSLFGREKTNEEQAYLKETCRVFDLEMSISPETFVLNNIMRSWRHLFIYDERLLRHVLEQAGFITVRRFPMMQSDDPVLRGLEHDTPHTTGLRAMESLVLEARKPL